jgi:type III secretory pathway component EscV
MKTKSIYVLIVVILLVVLALWLAKKLTNTEKKEKEEKEEQQNTGGGSGSSGNGHSYDTTLTQNATFPLQLTSPMKKGKNVRQLQNWLNRKKSAIYAPITVDGIFGAKTENLLLAVTGKKSMTELEFTSKGVYQESIL